MGGCPIPTSTFTPFESRHIRSEKGRTSRRILLAKKARMTRILYIKCSPRTGEHSASHRVATAYIDAARKSGHVETEFLDIWDTVLPQFDGHALEAKYVGLAGGKLSPRQSAAWQEIEELGRRLRDADQLLFSVPMWNFSIPYRMKHLIDLVTQKDVTFRFSDGAFSGLLKKQTAILICARGLGYGHDGLSENLYDYQESYLRSWLRFIGVEDIRTIKVEKTLMGQSESDNAIANGIEQAVALATSTTSGRSL